MKNRNFIRKMSRGGGRVQHLYANRKLAQQYPNLEDMAFKEFTGILKQRTGDDSTDENPVLSAHMTYFNRIIDLTKAKNVLVIGCGPMPQTMKILINKNYNVTGIEPVPSFVHSARQYLGSADADRVLEGSSESIPLPDHSQHLVICESILEHVDSPSKSLDEIFRVLAPGGITFISTTNRHRLSLTGDAGEFNVKYYNWLPDIIKECFVFQHLHYDPSLANYSLRPAVHWYSYADLCKIGRQAGFAHFYSIVDLADVNDPLISANKLRRFLLNKVKFNPWLRALVLTQYGASIIMHKR